MSDLTPQDPIVENTADKPEEQLGAQDITITVPFPDTFVYSNVSALSTSFMDVHISFAEVLPDKRVIARVGVALPPEHAAHFALNLLHQLNFFEKNFGAIRHPGWRAFNAKAKANFEALAANSKEPETE